MADWKPRAKRLGGDTSSLIQAGKKHMEAGRYEEALEAFEQELEQNPDSATAHLMLGNLCFRQEQFDDALEHYQSAMDINSNIAAPLVLSGNVYFQTDDLDRALADYEEALEIDPNLESANLQAGLREITYTIDTSLPVH